MSAVLFCPADFVGPAAAVVGLFKVTGVFFTGAAAGLLLGAMGTQDGLILFVVVGVVGVFGLPIELVTEGDRAKLGLPGDAPLASFAVRRIDRRSAGLTISYDGC